MNARKQAISNLGKQDYRDGGIDACHARMADSPSFGETEREWYWEGVNYIMDAEYEEGAQSRYRRELNRGFGDVRIFG